MFAKLSARLLNGFMKSFIAKRLGISGVSLGKMTIIIPVSVKKNSPQAMDSETIEKMINEAINKYVEPKLGNVFDLDLEVSVSE